MLRDRNLIPLSHQHQHALALCVQIDRSLQAGTADVQALQAQIRTMFNLEIRGHFAAEEEALFPEPRPLPNSSRWWISYCVSTLISAIILSGRSAVN